MQQSRQTSLKALLAGAASLLFLSGGAHAVTPVSDSDMTNMLNSGGVDLALAAAPMWFFGQAMNEPPCYPTSATDSSGNQIPSAPLCDYPDVGCKCRNPGVPISNQGPSFPVYFTFQKCSSTEVRVAYNLFYEKDGTNPDGILGHPYDWEDVLVVWAKGSDGNWTPSRIMLSQHGNYQTINWADIQNTLNTEDASQPLGGANGRTNLDHAKVYVAWSKHANYDTRNTGFNDPISQLLDNAFRSQDWWYFPQSSDYILADATTHIGQLLVSYNWGDATSNPVQVNSGLCSAS